MFDDQFMTDPILYLSMFLRFGGAYALISSFHYVDYGDDYGKRYRYYPEYPKRLNNSSFCKVIEVID